MTSSATSSIRDSERRSSAAATGVLLATAGLSAAIRRPRANRPRPLPNPPGDRALLSRLRDVPGIRLAVAWADTGGNRIKPRLPVCLRCARLAHAGSDRPQAIKHATSARLINKGSGSKLDLQIDLVNAALRLRVTPRPPRSLVDRDIGELVDGKAAPVSRRQRPASARASELEEERLGPSVLGPDHVRTQATRETGEDGVNLLLLENRLTNQRIDGARHRPMNRVTSTASASSAAAAFLVTLPRCSMVTLPPENLQVATARPSTRAKGRKMPFIVTSIL